MFRIELNGRDAKKRNEMNFLVYNLFVNSKLSKIKRVLELHAVTVVAMAAAAAGREGKNMMRKEEN